MVNWDGSIFSCKGAQVRSKGPARHCMVMCVCVGPDILLLNVWSR